MALVKKISSHIEEEVTLEVNGVEIICFAGVCPYEIEIGKEYPVIFTSLILDDYNIEELQVKTQSLERINEAYSYIAKGKLDGMKILSVIDIQDDGLLDFKYLNGKYVEFEIDRLDVEFL